MGQKLMEDVRIAGVAFTGSTATAKTIARTLIADDDRDIIPLIAETGGINAMIVDSTALARAGGAGRRSPPPSARPASAARRCACWCCRRISPSGRWRCWPGRWTR